MRLRPTIAATATAAFAMLGALTALPTAADSAEADGGGERRAAHPKRTVMVVGNNWDGTATVVDAATRKKLATIDIVPDLDEELQAIATTPDRLAFYLAVQQGVGEGHDQYVDDMFTTRNGRYLAVSRPSLEDVYLQLTEEVETE